MTKESIKRRTEEAGRYPEFQLKDRCLRLLKNLAHYRNGCAMELEDVKTVEGFVLAEIERAAKLLGMKV